MSDLPAPARRPTMYFIGVTTRRSSINQVFPLWAKRLELGNCELRGLDVPLHADPKNYRATVEFIKRDPLSLGPLVTTHKVDLFGACHDQFDAIEPLSRSLGEISCIHKRDGQLQGRRGWKTHRSGLAFPGDACRRELTLAHHFGPAHRRCSIFVGRELAALRTAFRKCFAPMKTFAWVLFGVPLIVSLPAQTGVSSMSAPGSTSAAVPPPSAAPLSKPTLEKIARMKPIFDGRTLDGWIQAPPAPTAFSATDFKNLADFVKKLAEKSDPVAAFLSEQLDDTGKTVLTSYSPNAPDPRPTTTALTRNLNRLVNGASLHDAARFKNVALRPETEALRQKNPQGQELARLNRVLLEDAFPDELQRSPVNSWMVKDGAMASTGGGRGVIYTKDDYAHYRLIFTMRHVSGNPDHQPCVLVFCTRPPAGERGLDALGGIQFQTPNGGHWDYRPGHNNAGEAFTRPVRTSFDNHQWHQVEILVDARTGTARMAVAQPVGTKAIENLLFKDPAAGKIGPLAWQMHNAGLFDEFKDARIEIDPAEDRLITVE